MKHMLGALSARFVCDIVCNRVHQLYLILCLIVSSYLLDTIQFINHRNLQKLLVPVGKKFFGSGHFLIKLYCDRATLHLHFCRAFFNLICGM